MTTYAESKGAKPFDWNEFLRRAIADELEPEEFLEAVDLSQNWVTCACGNQCDVIERNRMTGCPMDPTLMDLGTWFYESVKRGDWGSAQLALAGIESRSAELIAQMNEGKGGR